MTNEEAIRVLHGMLIVNAKENEAVSMATKALTSKYTFADYQKDAARTMDCGLDDVEAERHALHGMVSEIGELHGIYQKAYQGHRIETDHLIKECGDCLWFLAEFCTSQGWNMEDVARQNIAKLKARYPDGFDPEKSLHRKEGDV